MKNFKRKLAYLLYPKCKLAEDIIDNAERLLNHTTITSGVCMCGEEMPEWGYCDNHSSIDMGQYLAIQLQRDIENYRR